MTIGHEQITEALRGVLDPELGLSVVDLGLIYDVQINDGRVRIVMTMTDPACPLHDTMSAWVRQAVGNISGVDVVDVAVTFEPPWTPDRIQRVTRR